VFGVVNGQECETCRFPEYRRDQAGKVKVPIGLLHHRLLKHDSPGMSIDLCNGDVSLLSKTSRLRIILVALNFIVIAN
jgi:hypothetical protein